MVIGNSTDVSLERAASIFRAVEEESTRRRISVICIVYSSVCPHNDERPTRLLSCDITYALLNKCPFIVSFSTEVLERRKPTSADTSRDTPSIQWNNKGRFTHNMSRPCCAAKGLECVFPNLIYTVRPCLIHTCHAALMPSPTMQFFSRPRQSMAAERRVVWLTASVRLLPAITRSSTKLLSEAYQSQMQVASVKPNTIYHGRGKDW